MRKVVPLPLLIAGLLGGCILPDIDRLTVGGAADAGEAGADVAPIDGGGGGDALVEAEAAAPDAGKALFFDDFNRPNGTSIGNGWIEKRPASFELLSGTVNWLGGAVTHKDHVMYRPSSEDALDVLVSVELSIASTASTPGLPQVLARIQAATAATAGTLDGYVLYVEDSFSSARLGRTRGTSTITNLATLTMSPPMVAGGTYRLSLSVSGTNPVTLSGKIEAKSGSTWSVIGTQAYSDTDALRVSTAGAGALSGGSAGAAGAYAYDNFTIRLP